MLKMNKFVRAMLGITIFVILAAFSPITENKSKDIGSRNSGVEIDPSKPIQVDGGKITGTLSSDSEVAVYKGIPFAAPPVGDLRWKDPQPVVKWKGGKEADTFGPSCIQPDQAPFLMWSTEFIIDTTKGYSEDCLSLNVWTQTESDSKNRPVIVYIHGGGNTSGGSSVEVYDGEAIAKKDAVYVSINYRLGILGFLAHPELSAESKDEVSGNYAVLDQIAALEWVKKNIHKFGGDPKNVTIAGQSAGSANVNTLALSPKAHGLFKNAVAMSFNVVNSKYPTLAESEEAGSTVFEGKTLEEMRALPTDQLLSLRFNGGYTIDGKVVTDQPINVLKKGAQNDVAMMTGYVQGDTSIGGVLQYGGFFVPQTSISKVKYEELVKQVFGTKASEVLALYPATGDEAVSQFNAVNQDAMKASQLAFAKARALQGKAPTYVYYFDHVMPGEDSEQFGAFHTADVPYFLNYFSPLREDFWTQTDYDLGDKMSKYLVNFAKTGNPNGGKLPNWKAYNGIMSFIHFGDQVTTTKLSAEKAMFWEDYYDGLLGL